MPLLIKYFLGIDAYFDKIIFNNGVRNNATPLYREI